jgi:hypothetical protein
MRILGLILNYLIDRVPDLKVALVTAIVFAVIVVLVRSYYKGSRDQRSIPANGRAEVQGKSGRVRRWWRSLSRAKKLTVIVAGGGLIGLTAAMAAGVGVGLLGVIVSMVALAVTTLTVADNQS